MSILNQAGAIAMKKSRFSEEQISFALKQAEAGTQVKEVVLVSRSWVALFG